MLSNRLMPALLIVLPTTTLLAAQATFSAAAAECKLKPGPSAPRGEHWYWRVDRATNQRCWFLATREAVHSQAARPAISYRRVRPHKVLSTAHAERDGKLDRQTSAAPAPAAAPASAGLSATEAAGPVFAGDSASEQELADFSARWPELQRVGDLEAPVVTTTMSYTDEPAAVAAPVGIQAKPDARPPSRDENATPGLRGALLIALLLLAGGGITLVRRLDRPACRGDRQPMERRPQTDSDFARTDGMSASWRKAYGWVRTPTNPLTGGGRMAVERGSPRVSPARRPGLRLPQNSKASPR
jgi:hypothetical protein